MRKIAAVAVAISLAGTQAAAQVTSIQSNNPSPKGGPHDLDRIVCEVDQTTGTRLGARKVCKTVLEWQQLTTEHREMVERFQRMNTSQGCQEGQGCM